MRQWSEKDNYILGIRGREQCRCGRCSRRCGGKEKGNNPTVPVNELRGGARFMERVEISGSNISSRRPSAASACVLLFSTPNKTLLHVRNAGAAQQWICLRNHMKYKSQKFWAAVPEREGKHGVWKWLVVRRWMKEHSNQGPPNRGVRTVTAKNVPRKFEPRRSCLALVGGVFHSG